MALTIRDITDVAAGKTSDTQFKASPFYDAHEQVVYAEDPDINFRSIISIHNTNRGEALGGCRYSPYYKSHDDALKDVLRLSRGMTYKNALARLELGGGKSVIIGPEGQAKPTPEMMEALGKVVESLGGRYVTAEDMNVSEKDMMTVWGVTRHVCGIPLGKVAQDRLPAGFDIAKLPGANPSPYTAYGTFMGIKACVGHKKGQDDLNGIRVAVKGAAGAVGSVLCDFLHDAGAELVVSDHDGNKRAQARLVDIAAEYGARIVTSAEIMGEDVDVYAPCARGADINDQTIDMIKADIVAGCANNVLAEERHAEELRKRGILYAQDYVINAGGVICAGVQHLWLAHSDRYPVPEHDVVMKRIEGIYDGISEIIVQAEKENRNTTSVAAEIARREFQKKSLMASSQAMMAA